MATGISDLHTKLKMINRGVPGLATGNARGFEVRGWTTFLMYYGPLLGLWFLNVCNFGIVERILSFYQFLVIVCLHITQFLPVIFLLSIFLPWNSFLFLYQILSYYKDAVWTLLIKALFHETAPCCYWGHNTPGPLYTKLVVRRPTAKSGEISKPQDWVL